MAPEERELLAEAQCVLCRAKFQVLEEQALATLSGRRGLSLACLWPDSPVLQVAALNGVRLGRVRRAHSANGRCEWFAVAHQGCKPSGPFPSDRAAARSLARQR